MSRSCRHLAPINQPCPHTTNHVPVLPSYSLPRSNSLHYSSQIMHTITNRTQTLPTRAHACSIFHQVAPLLAATTTVGRAVDSVVVEAEGPVEAQCWVAPHHRVQVHWSESELEVELHIITTQQAWGEVCTTSRWLLRLVTWTSHGRT